MKRLFGILVLCAFVWACEKDEMILEDPSSNETEFVLGEDNSRSANSVAICHRKGNGDFITINVNPNAVDAHLAHGDILPDADGNCSIAEVTPGYSDLTEAAGVRFRGASTGNEIYIGVPDLGQGGNRNEAAYTWNEGTYDVTFSYDPVENSIVTTINGTTLTYDFDDEPVGPTCDPADWNTMDINLVDRNAGADDLRVENFTLNGQNLGNFDIDGWNNWTVTGIDFSAAWTVEAELIVVGTWDSSERDKFQIVVGCD